MTRPDAPTMTLRVLVDSGPAARELFDITLKADDTVADVREAIAAQIGQASMSLFKVSPGQLFLHYYYHTTCPD